MFYFLGFFSRNCVDRCNSSASDDTAIFLYLNQSLNVVSTCLSVQTHKSFTKNINIQLSNNIKFAYIQFDIIEKLDLVK